LPREPALTLALSMNLPLKKEPPLPNPLLHKYVEERGMERRGGFMGSMREYVRRILSPRRGNGAARRWEKSLATGPCPTLIELPPLLEVGRTTFQPMNDSG